MDIWGAILQRYPPPFREFLPVGRSAVSSPVAGRADAAERCVRLIADVLIVDMNQSGRNLLT
jgi:hypothetical protein